MTDPLGKIRKALVKKTAHHSRHCKCDIHQALAALASLEEGGDEDGEKDAGIIRVFLTAYEFDPAIPKASPNLILLKDSKAALSRLVLRAKLVKLQLTEGKDGKD